MNLRARFLSSLAVLFTVQFHGLLSLHAQSQETSPAGSSQQSNASLEAFLAEQQSLMEERQTLIANGATQAQLRAWQEQNASQLDAQRQLAGSLSAAATLQLSSTNTQPNIPSNVSPSLASFLTLQAALAQGRAQNHNNLVQSLSPSSTPAQIKAALNEGSASFQQLNSANLALAVQGGQTLAAQAAQTPLPVPQPPQFPANADPQMIAFQTQFYQLNLQRIQLWNQYAGASPEVRKAALRAWRAQNATAIEQLQQQSQTLSQTISTTTN